MSVVSLAAAAAGFAGGAAAAPDPSFSCVVVNVDTCTVTIPLTSNMDEQVSSTMPDTQPWFLNEANGQGPYGLTGPGNPETTWDGVGGALQGTLWSAILTTGANEPAGSQAVLTFAHVTPSSTSTTLAGQPYSSISGNYPLRVADGSVASVTALVRPVPAKGHVVLQRRSGSSWVTVGTMTYSGATQRWSLRFVWRFAKHATVSFRVLATAAPGLSATYGATFKISTLA